MKRLAGQAGRTIGGFLHLLGMFFITLFLVLAVLLGGVAYRPQPRAAADSLGNDAAGKCGVGRGYRHPGRPGGPGWAGYKKGGSAPLYLQLGNIAVHNAGGVLLAAIPDARLALTPSEIFSRQSAIYVTSTDARFAGADVPVSLLAGIHLGRGFRLDQADLWVTLGAGQLGPPGLAEPIDSGKFLLAVTPKDARLTDGQLTACRLSATAPR